MLVEENKYWLCILAIALAEDATNKNISFSDFKTMTFLQEICNRGHSFK